jgi:signal transduction histidine kinase
VFLAERSNAQSLGLQHWIHGLNPNGGHMSQSSSNSSPNKEQQYLQLALETQQFAHDLRTPIMVLQQALKKATHADPLIQKGVERLLEISNHYLDHKRKSILSNAQPTSTLKHLSLGEFKNLVKNTIQSIPLLTQELNKTCQISFLNYVSLQNLVSQNKNRFLCLEESELKNIIENILKNAIEALPAHQQGELRCSIYIEKETLCLEIQDNGQGIESSVLDKLNQGQAYTYNKTNGHGLGLSHAYRTLKQWKASLQIESYFKKGTTVIIKFPLISKIPSSALN